MMMTQQKQINCQNTIISLCQLANRMIHSPKEHQQLLREYINIYIQNKKKSQDFFIYFCQHNILHKLFATNKYLRPITVLQLFNLLLSNTNQPNDLIYIFSQPIVHQYLFGKINLYGEDGETIEYFVQLIKTIIMKASCPENQFLIKLFCNKRFSSFPLLTVATILGVRRQAEQMVKITAQQCVLLLINLINTKKTGLVYLNQLQVVVFFHELTSQMLDFQQNKDQQGSIKYLIDLIITLKDNKISICLLLNALTSNLFFKQKRKPVQILRFLLNFRQISIQYKQIKEEIMQNIIRIFYRIFCKLYCGKFINFTYYSAQYIIPALSISPQPKLLKFFQERSKSIEDYLINQEDYSKNQKDIDLIFQQWYQFNNKAANSPTKKAFSKSKAIKEFFSNSDSSVERYIEGVMTSAGLDIQKINTPIIKLTFSSNFRTSVFLVQKILLDHEGTKSNDFQEQFCKEEYWKLTPSIQFFVISYQIFLIISQKREKSSVLMQQLEPQEQFLEKIYPKIAKLVTEQLISMKLKPCKPYLLLLYKIINKMCLRQQLQSYLIEHLLKKLYELQKLLSQMVFIDQNFPSFLKYAIRNEKKPFFRDSLEIKTIQGEIQNQSKRTLRLQHYLIYYELIKNYLDSSIKSLNEFLKQYWQIKLALSQKNKKSYKSLAVYKDALGNYLEIYPNQYYQFEIRHYKSITQPIAKFKISEKDFKEENINSADLKTQQYGRLHFTDSKKAKDFINDIKLLRLRRQQIFRMAIIQYMPFIYESIQIKYRQRGRDLDSTSN